MKIELFDGLEQRAPEQRESELMAQLPAQVAHAKNASAAFTSILQGIAPEEITSRQALASLPVMRKHALLALQIDSRRSGGNVFGGGGDLAVWPLDAAGVCQPRPYLRARRQRARLLAHGAPYFCRWLSCRRTDPQQLQLPLRSRGLDDGNRRQRLGLQRCLRLEQDRLSSRFKPWLNSSQRATSVRPVS